MSLARKQTIVFGLLVRLLCLGMILLFAQYGIEPYMLSDDRSYETLAVAYLKIADSVIDFDAFDRIGASGYLEVFYPWLTCISAKVLGSIYASRLLNCFFSAACIGVVFDLTMLVAQKEKIALCACRLFAYLPLTVLTCCFPIKDIFLTYATMRVFLQIIAWQKRKQQTLLSYVWCFLLLVAISRTRGAIVEYFLIVVVVFCGERLLKTRNYSVLAVVSLVACIFLPLFWEVLAEAFITKVDDYAGVVETGNGIKLIQMRTPWEIYKIPFSYFYATLQPMSLNYFSKPYPSIWMNGILLLNISIYPIAISNYIYIIEKKENLLFWITTAILFAAISALSLGNSRHYLFLLPIEIVNASIVWHRSNDNQRRVIAILTFCLFALIAGLSAW